MDAMELRSAGRGTRMGCLRTAWCELFHSNHSWPMAPAKGKPAEQECFDCGRGWVSEVLGAGEEAGRRWFPWLRRSAHGR